MLPIDNQWTPTDRAPRHPGKERLPDVPPPRMVKCRALKPTFACGQPIAIGETFRCELAIALSLAQWGRVELAVEERRA